MAHAHTALLNLYYPDMTVPITETIGDWAQGFVDNMAILDASVTNTALAAWVGSANITTLGTIATGTWSATKIAVAKGGTNLSTVAAGSVLVANILDTISALTSTVGTLVLTNTAGVISWEVGGGGVTAHSDLTELAYADAGHTGFEPTLAANNKIDHTTVTLTAGVGLSGGGDISANRTFTFDATELEAITWGGGAQATIVHTFNVSGTDTTMTYGNGIITSSCPLNATTGFQIATVAAAGTILRGNGTNFVASTFTIPDTMAINTILYASAANVISALATGNSGVLVTGAGGIPSISTTLPSGLTFGTLAANWDIGDTVHLITDTVIARDAAGLELFEDGGKGITIADSSGDTTFACSNVYVNNASGVAVLEINGTGNAFQYSNFLLSNKLADANLRYWFFSHRSDVLNQFQMIYYNGSIWIAPFSIKSTGESGFGTLTQSAKVSINGGFHVGGDSDPGDNNILVDGTAHLDGAVTCDTTLTVTGNVGIACAAPGAGGYNLLINPASGDAAFGIKRSNNTTGQAYCAILPTGANSASNVSWSFGMLANSNTFNIQAWNGATTTPYLAVLNTGCVNALFGLHVGGTSDPGDNNLLVDGSIQIRDSGIYIKSQADTFMDIVADGGVRIGDGIPTNYANFSPIGNLSFVGTAGFYPRRIRQNAIPAAGTGATEIDTGELVMWCHADGADVVSLVYNDATKGIVSIALA
jgi:hypothetical protein